MKEEMLRNIPKLSELLEETQKMILNSKEKGNLTVDLSLLTLTAREKTDMVRRMLLDGKSFVDENDEGLSEKDALKKYLCKLIVSEYEMRHTMQFKNVINATGITLHTNLGRAPLSKDAALCAYYAATHYSNLEYDIESGKRSERYQNVEELLKRLCKAEGALVVNNNAAAVMLILHALGYRKNMVISRGELVEIGGSFRIPAVMEISGVVLKETGCTNKTYLSDYEGAIDNETAGILKVHDSNFSMSGFVHETTCRELMTLSEKYDIPVIYDMGSAGFDELELTTDVACFSGDKLLGGPQCGIVVGKKKYIDLIKKDNLLRALRVDKMTLASLEETLWEYEENKGINLPVNVFLQREVQIMEKMADYIILSSGNKEGTVLSKTFSDSFVGGGSKPGETLTDVCITVADTGRTSEELARYFRSYEIPIIGRIHEDCFMLDLRCVYEDEMQVIIKAINDLQT